MLAYLEHLISQGLGYRTIRNYVSAIRNNLACLGVPFQSWDSDSIYRLHGAVSKASGPLPRPKPVLSVSQIDVMFRVNVALPSPNPYAAAFVLGIFAFLRILHLVPTAPKKFDPPRQVCVVDVTFDRRGTNIKLN